MHTYASSYAQKVSLNKSNASLKEVLDEIRTQTDYSFIVSSSMLNEAVPVSINVKDVSLKEVLEKCFSGQPLSYTINNKTIVVTKPLGSATNRFKDVKGTVRDSTGVIPGVSVAVKGTRIGTTTDQNGKYILDVPEANAVLVFSMVGFETQEIAVNGKETIDVTMVSSDKGLDEVVVVAFGKQKKTDMVGSVTSIKPSDLKVPSSNLTTALAGRAAGVIAYQRSGEPGADNAEFFIRGVTSFGYKRDPLILIDGVEVTTTDMARLQADDIASFSIMKDATATSLYGSRAANGVILISTKEGLVGKAAIEVRVENSVSAPTSEVEIADPITYMRLNNEAILTRDPLGILPYSDEKIDNTIAGTNALMYPTTDWKKELFNPYTVNQRANLNVRGGGGVATYFIAGSFNQDNGILKVDKRNNFNSNIDLKSYTLRSNVNVNLTKSTEVIVRMSGSFDDYSGPVSSGADIYRRVMRTNPVRFPAYYPADEEHAHVKHIMFGNYGSESDGYLLNPYSELVKGYKDYSRSAMSAQFEAKQNLSFLTEGLNINALANITRNTFFDVRREYAPFWYMPTSYDRRANTFRTVMANENTGTEYLNYIPGARTVNSRFYLQSSLNYARTLKEKHSLSGLFVFMLRDELTGDVTDLQSSLPFRNIGLAGRATYGYDNRYYAEFNFGYNGSERFYETNRWGFFPSAGVAWNVSNEKFWEPLKDIITKLKLRGTYGLSGNDAIGSATDRFLYLSNVNMNDAGRGAVFGRDNGYQRNGVSLSRYANNDITWETARKTNIALELDLFRDWSLQVDFFKENRDGILMTRTATPATMGLSAQPKANIGEAEGQGVDLSINYNHSFNNGLWLQTMGNFTYAASKYLKFEEPFFDEAPWKRRAGTPISQNYGYIAERLFIDDEEALRSPRQFGEYGGGDIKYYDVNGDGQITTLDQVPIGHPTTPEITYGFGFSLGYKNFDVSTFFQGLARESFWIDANATAPFANYFYSGETLPGMPQNQLLKAYADNHWSEEHQNAYALWPRLSTTSVGNENNNQTSTWFMRNGSFLRIKQVEIGYNLPQRLSKRLAMKKFRAYVNGTNLWSFSGFDLWDIEMAGNGLGYPVQRVFNLGLLASF
ncbi:SusC/RagA family TonB-linked outer membrane protein [Pedobacter psychroterrae]|uniref:SusC/RagA family TonB-linked outer membrane protein n=2 Tax=Pedobacter psychroterrae TaxID=2530453 RepID=A0A4R0NL63_9SPHI|nr:SusC/RagA family TonB-linked outer membrane protein [Pedobacter psychroterrae]